MWRSVGVSGHEEVVYEALARHRQATTEDMLAGVGLSRPQLTRTLVRLVDRGLVTRLPGRPARYAAVPPDEVAASLIAERERELLRLRAHANRLAEEVRRQDPASHHPAEVIQVIEGGANLRATFVRLQREARVQIRGFDRPPYLDNPVGGNSEENQQLSHRGLTYRVVYDQSALAIPGRMADIWRGIQRGEQARVYARVPMKMALCDDRLALIPVLRDGDQADAAYLVHPSSLLDAFSELFEAVWDRAVAVNKSGQAQPDGLSDRDADLVGLLAGGATDETIARTLGWSVRTVHRHVHRIMSMVGAQTRFQAGMEAVRRGWI
jgi:DNA-binding CsgD family transcriptional regulator/DNA-binding transcriptional ArsR family regulator